MIIAVATVFLAVFTSCDDETGNVDTQTEWFDAGALDDVYEYLIQNANGDTPDNAIHIIVNIHLGTMTNANSGWQQLLKTINSTYKYVDLDLSGSTMNGVEFNPDYRIATGKGRIVSLILPDAARGIINGNNAHVPFTYFYSLKSISGAMVKTIGNYAFSPVSSNRIPLVNVSFPVATNIGHNAFFACLSLENVNIPAATTIGSSAFYYCTSLVNVSFLVATTIGSGAFDRCNFLENVNIPAATTIGSRAFNDCRSLESVSFPVATTIGSNAFSGCTSLENVDFPAAATIGDYAFSGCTSLESVSFPAAATINNNPFIYCTSLTSFNLTGSGNLSVFENGRALVRNNTELVSYPSASGIITMPAITSIGDSALSGTSLVSADFPAATTIGDWAFQRCSSLESVNFPVAVTIGDWAFYGIRSKNVSFPAAVTIGREAFRRSWIESVSFPVAETIGREAFSGCTFLESASFPAVITIGEYVFEICTSLQSVSFPAVTRIGRYAFSGCTGLPPLKWTKS